MTAADIIYHARRELVLMERAKGPARRIAERAFAVVALNRLVESWSRPAIWADANVLLQSTERMH